MATSAFRSTSRRGSSDPKPTNPRRSHSVSAVSRKTHLTSDDSNSISSEFSVRRDNPLFWTASSSPTNEDEVNRKNGEIIKQASCSSSYVVDRSSSSSTSELRGRSVTRNGGVVKNGIGRSLSRARGQSVSRPHDKVVYESGNELDTATSINTRARNKNEHIGNEMNRINRVRNKVERRGAKNSRVTAIHNQEIEWSEDDTALSLHISNFEDGLSMGSFTEVEEKTIKAACADLNAIEIQAFQRNTINIDTVVDVHDMPPDLMNPAAIALVPCIRREYSIKWQESQERARKLRADLAIEEHRGKEIGRILEEIIPGSEISSVPKSQRERRTSTERKRMSKCLSEEARAYFDECVSLSTFDSSDFSASEDPANSSVGTTTTAGPSSLRKGSPNMLFCHDHVNEPHQKQALPPHSSVNFGMAIKSSSSEPGIGTQSYHFSFADKQSKSEDIRSYIKHFERGTKDLLLVEKRSCYDAGEYSVHGRFENEFIDRVLYKSRLDPEVYYYVEVLFSLFCLLHEYCDGMAVSV